MSDVSRARSSKDSDISMTSNDTSASSIQSRRSSRNHRRDSQQMKGPERPSWSNKRCRTSESDDTDEDDADDHDIRPSIFPDVCLCKPEPKIPRPSNSFILYRKHHQANILAQNPGLTNPEISKLIGEQWKNTSPEVKKEWKALAEEEKVRHQQQYPEYRYQPKRTSRSGPSDTSPSCAPPRCQRCGGRSILTPTTPLTPHAGKPILPPLTPSTMNGLTLMSPTMRRGSRQHIPPRLDVSIGGYNHEDGSQSSAGDLKRRRYTNAGGYLPAGRVSVGTPYPLVSPYHDTFHRWPAQMTPGVMAPPPRPVFPHLSPFQQPDMSLTLPPLQNDKPDVKKEEQTKREELLKREPQLLMIDTLSRVSPPFKLNQPAPDQTRGSVIAVEGDDAAAVVEVVDYLATCLGLEHTIRIAQGPRGPPEGQHATMGDYYALIKEWHQKNQEIVVFISPESAEKGSTSADSKSNLTDDEKTPTANTPFQPFLQYSSSSNPKTSSSDTASIKPPLLLIHRYQLYAARTHALCVPIIDAYSPWDHWKWIASLWRGITGPDLTVYVKDYNPPVAPNPQTSGAAAAPTTTQTPEVKSVEIYPQYRTVVIRKAKTPVGGRSKMEESALRRLGFEVGELMRVRRS